MTFKWKRLQQETPTEAEIQSWFGSGSPNIALVTGNGLVVVDVDVADQDFLQEIHRARRRHADEVPNAIWGRPFVLRDAEVRPVRKRREDQGQADRPAVRRGVRGCSLEPERDGRAVPLGGQVLPVSALPLLRVSWLRDRKPKRVLTPVEVSGDLDALQRRARAYVATIEGAVSGNRGHDRAMRVAGVLCQKFGLSFDQAWPIFKEWSETTCDPRGLTAKLPTS